MKRKLILLAALVGLNGFLFADLQGAEEEAGQQVCYYGCQMAGHCGQFCKASYVTCGDGCDSGPPIDCCP
ncbi:MAG TPA: hypothetical protein VK025_02895 [Steroidobacter sp.]|nr:hypothetical protein [Steroidobacter sp.]